MARRRWVAAGVAAVGAVAVLAPIARRQAAVVRAIDPDFRALPAYLPISVGPGTVRLERLARRAPQVPRDVVGEVALRVLTLPADDGLAAVAVRVYDPPGRSQGGGALLWIHGGGYVIGAAALDDESCAGLARRLGVLVVSVDYRLAPEHPFPAAHEDCLRALRWMHDAAEDLCIDPARIAVGGESAGGGLAAGLAQRAHDDGIGVCFQYLMYPMLDDATVTRAERDGGWNAVWTPRSNRFGWTAYLGHAPGGDDARPYAVPARRVSLAGLPPAWIGVGTVDLFADEDIAYAQRLRADGVDCELIVVPGMYHAGARFSPNVPAARAFAAAGERALAGALGPQRDQESRRAR